MSTPGSRRAILARPDFRRLLTTRLASQLADGVFQASLAGSVFFNPDRRTDPVDVALGFAVLILPYSVLGPFAGVFLDRVRRRSVLLGASLLRGVAVPGIGALIWTGEEGAPFLLAALAVTGLNRFFLTGLSASLPHVTDPDRLVTANALTTTAGTVAFAVGGGVALGLRALVGPTDHGYAVVAAASALGYLVSAWAARGFAPDRLGPDAHAPRSTVGEVLRGMVEGARHVAERRGAGYLLLALTAHRVLFGVSLIATLLLYRNTYADGGVFRSGLPGLGQVVVAGALGALAAAVLTPWATRRTAPRRCVTFLLVAAAAVELALGLPYAPPATVAAAFLIGVVGQGIKIITDTAIQTECGENFQGRVFSVYDTLFNVALVTGLVVGAVALPASGRSYAVLTGVAVAYAAAGAGYAWAASRWHRRSGFLATGHPGTLARTVAD